MTGWRLSSDGSEMLSYHESFLRQADWFRVLYNCSVIVRRVRLESSSSCRRAPISIFPPNGGRG